MEDRWRNLSFGVGPSWKVPSGIVEDRFDFDVGGLVLGARPPQARQLVGTADAFATQPEYIRGFLEDVFGLRDRQAWPDPWQEVRFLLGLLFTEGSNVAWVTATSCKPRSFYIAQRCGMPSPPAQYQPLRNADKIPDLGCGLGAFPLKRLRDHFAYEGGNKGTEPVRIVREQRMCDPCTGRRFTAIEYPLCLAHVEADREILGRGRVPVQVALYDPTDKTMTAPAVTMARLSPDRQFVTQISVVFLADGLLGSVMASRRQTPMFLLTHPVDRYLLVGNGVLGYPCPRQ